MTNVLELQFLPLNYYVVTTLLNFLTSFFLALFVLLRNRRSVINKTFAIFCFAIAQWSFFYFLFLSTKETRLSEFFIRTCMIGVIFMPSTFTHFISVFLDIKHNKKLIIVNYLISLTIAATVYSNLYAKQGSSFLIFPYWPLPGKLFAAHLLQFFVNLTYSYYFVLKTLKRNKGILREQIRYVFLGTALGFLGGLTNYFCWYRIAIPPFLNITASLGVPVIAYAVVRYRLMNIDLAWRYGLSNFLYALIGLIIFTPLFLVLKGSLIGLVALFFIGFLFAPLLHRRLIKIVQPAILGGKYNYWNDLKGFWDNQRDVYTSSQLFDVLEEIPAVMGLKSFSFFMFDRDRSVFVPLAFKGLDGVFDPEQAKVLSTLYPDDSLPLYLEKEKKIINKDEAVDAKVTEQMNGIKAQLSVPLFAAGRLTAILNLGPKKNQEMYHQQDMELLKEVARLAEKDLAHISFFESSLFFSGSVAHDIRKPFNQGIISDYLNNICKGLDNPASASCAKEAMVNLKNCLENVHNMSEDMVSAFKNLEIFLKSGFKPQKIDYAQKVVLESASFKTLAQNKGIVFEMILPKEPLFVYAEPTSTQRILNELLTNAIKYTDKGKITVKVSQDGLQGIITEVIDSGCGIPEEDQEAIWELFKRGENGQRKEGAGIGLAMVRQLIEANSGKISVNSSKGNGSNFFFTLPAWEDRKAR